MKKLFVLLASAMICVAGVFTSCDNDDVQNVQITVSGTLEGDYPNYTFYVDGGGTITPSLESVVEYTGGKGFSNVKRAWMVFIYEQSNLTYAPSGNPAVQGEPIIKNARIVGGQTIPTASPMTAAEAEEKKQTSADSLFSIVRFEHVWYYHGYLTTRISGNYSVKNNKGIYPTMNLVYDKIENSSDTLHVHLCYNRHSSNNDATGGVDVFDTSFTIGNLLRAFDRDSVNVVVAAEGVKDYVIKLPTK